MFHFILISDEVGHDHMCTPRNFNSLRKFLPILEFCVRYGTYAKLSNYTFLSLVLQVNFLCVRGRKVLISITLALAFLVNTFSRCWCWQSTGFSNVQGTSRKTQNQMQNIGTSFYLVAYWHWLTRAAWQNVWPVYGQNITESTYMYMTEHVIMSYRLCIYLHM